MKREKEERLEELERKEAARKKQESDRRKRYDTTKVDRMAFTLPKGRKEDVQKAAAARGQSVNAFLQSVVLEAIDGTGRK